MPHRIDLSDPNWPEVVRAREEAKRKSLNRTKAAVHRVRSKAYKMGLETLGAIHNAQHGRCASCDSPIKAVGRGRALDQVTNKMVCQGCAIVLGITERSVPRLRQLIHYLESAQK
jgi:RNA polymerase-binding transcription factor DksA